MTVIDWFMSTLGPQFPLYRAFTRDDLDTVENAPRAVRLFNSIRSLPKILQISIPIVSAYDIGTGIYCIRQNPDRKRGGPIVLRPADASWWDRSGDQIMMPHVFFGEIEKEHQQWLYIHLVQKEEGGR